MDHGFPGSVSTTVTVTTENTTVNRTIRYDKSYIKSRHGWIKIAEIILDLIGFICIVSSTIGIVSRGQFFNTVAMGGFWMSLIILLLYTFHVVERFYKIPWLKIETILYGVWVILYIIAASLCAAYARVSEAFGVAAFFGFCAMVVYAYDAWLKYNMWMSGGIAQGQRQVNKPIPTVASPNY